MEDPCVSLAKEAPLLQSLTFRKPCALDRHTLSHVFFGGEHQLVVQDEPRRRLHADQAGRWVNENRVVVLRCSVSTAFVDSRLDSPLASLQAVDRMTHCVIEVASGECLLYRHYLVWRTLYHHLDPLTKPCQLIPYIPHPA